MLGNLRQFFNYSKDFRIEAPKASKYDDNLDKIVNLLKSQLANTELKPEKDDGLIKLTAEIGTTAWRLQRRLTTTSETSDTIKRVSRDLESVWDALIQGGLEIKDHTGEKYDGGMALNVIAFQPTPGITKEQVIETIKPTIFHKNKMVQMGQVVVGVPEKISLEDTPK
ncbi:MAG: hypothetical protein PHU23_04465 [Dehalococcoidales bacterium]|nr:hypothetical protein [Dehalococcoidales bacterium]